MSPRAKRSRRGGVRPGAGRPRVRDGDGPRVDVELDEASGMGAIALSQELGVTIPCAIRTLLSAWHRSPDVRRAVAAAAPGASPCG